jgi:hypothetical protein
MVSEKQIAIDATFKKDPYLRHKHLLQTFDLLSTIYPEVKKVKKLTSVIMKGI